MFLSNQTRSMKVYSLASTRGIFMNFDTITTQMEDWEMKWKKGNVFLSLHFHHQTTHPPTHPPTLLRKEKKVWRRRRSNSTNCSSQALRVEHIEIRIPSSLFKSSHELAKLVSRASFLLSKLKDGWGIEPLLSVFVWVVPFLSSSSSDSC